MNAAEIIINFLKEYPYIWKVEWLAPERDLSIFFKGDEEFSQAKPWSAREFEENSYMRLLLENLQERLERAG